jgi:DinB superfamily
MEDIRYPIGKFSAPENYTEEEIKSYIQRIEALPSKLESAIQNLNDEQLDTPYREGGWTVRQVVHHLADSHMHAYIRTKWTLTESEPVIKAYLEKLWAETGETKSPPLISISLLKALHAKWVILLRSIAATDRERYFVHPETKKQIAVNTIMGMYAWHGEHHLAHITNLKKLKNW